MPERKRPTIIDVALAADVGPSTVSRHVRGSKSVSPKVAERIQRAIAALGYQPNAVARSLRIGRTQTLGLLFPHVNNVFYGHAMRTIQDEARLSGFTVMLLTHQEDAKLQQEQLASLKRAQVDGVILLPAAGTNVSQVRTLLGNTPLVAFDRTLDKSIDSVVLDNYRAGRKATEHLLSHEYSHIIAVNVAYKLQPLQSLQDRLRGYKDAMESAGKHPQTIIWQDAEQLREDLRAVVERPGPSSAILSVSYSVTLAILSALQEIQFDLHDIGLIGIDDMEFSSFIHPPLTTLAQPAEELARRAVQQLLRRTANQTEGGSAEKATHVMLPGTLILRASCGCRMAAGSGQPRPMSSSQNSGSGARREPPRRRPRSESAGGDPATIVP